MCSRCSRFIPATNSKSPACPITYPESNHTTELMIPWTSTISFFSFGSRITPIIRHMMQRTSNPKPILFLFIPVPPVKTVVTDSVRYDLTT